MEIRKAYDRMCENGALKKEFNIVERKGLTRALGFPMKFKIELIKIILSRNHDGYGWKEVQSK